MHFLNLHTFSAFFIVSGMAFQRMLPRKAREFMPKDIVLVGGLCSVFLIRRSYVSPLCTKNSHFISFHFKLFIQGKKIQFIRKKNCFTMCPVKTEKKKQKEKN